MNESGFTRKVNGHLRSGIYSWKISDRFTAGIPDAYYSGRESDLWVEYKLIKGDLHSTSLPAALSKLQAKWLRDRMEEGRNVAVIVGVGTTHGLILTGASIFQPLVLEDKVTVAELADWISNRVDGADWPD